MCVCIQNSPSTRIKTHFLTLSHIAAPTSAWSSHSFTSLNMDSHTKFQWLVHACSMSSVQLSPMASDNTVVNTCRLV